MEQTQQQQQQTTICSKHFFKLHATAWIQWLFILNQVDLLISWNFGWYCLLEVTAQTPKLLENKQKKNQNSKSHPDSLRLRCQLLWSNRIKLAGNQFARVTFQFQYNSKQQRKNHHHHHHQQQQQRTAKHKRSEPTAKHTTTKHTADQQRWELTFTQPLSTVYMQKKIETNGWNKMTDRINEYKITTNTKSLLYIDLCNARVLDALARLHAYHTKCQLMCWCVCVVLCCVHLCTIRRIQNSIPINLLNAPKRNH